MSDFYSTVWVSPSGDDSTATPSNPYFSTIDAAVAVKPQKIVLQQTASATEFKFVPLDVQCTGLTLPGFYCGYIINEGETEKYITGSPESPVDAEIVIRDGIFTKITCFTSRVHASNGEIRHYGKVDVLIEGGTFSNALGPWLHTGSTTTVTADLYGDTYIRIKGGIWLPNNAKCFVHAGSFGTNMPRATVACVHGNTHIILDSSDRPLAFTSCDAGYGNGRTDGNYELTITGSNQITGDVFYGGNYGDDTDITGAPISELCINGDRTLKFDAFTSTFSPGWLQEFNRVEFVGKSDFLLTRNSNPAYLPKFDDQLPTFITLTYTSEWTFECGSKATFDSTMSLDHTGHTFNLVEYTVGTHKLLTGPASVFTGFGSLAGIQIDGSSVSSTYDSSTQTYTLADGSTLGLEADGDNMSLVFRKTTWNNTTTKAVVLKDPALPNYIFPKTQLSNVDIQVGQAIDVSGDKISCLTARAGTEDNADAGVVRPSIKNFIVDETGYMTIKRGSESVAGILQIATNEEVAAGTNDYKAITPAGLKNAISACIVYEEIP